MIWFQVKGGRINNWFWDVGLWKVQDIFISHIGLLAAAYGYNPMIDYEALKWQSHEIATNNVRILYGTDMI